LKKNVGKEGYYIDQLAKKFKKCPEGCKKCVSLEECLECDFDSGYFSLKIKEDFSSKNNSKLDCVKKCPDSFVKSNEKKTCIA